MYHFCQRGVAEESPLTFRRHSDFVGASGQASMVGVQSGHMTRAIAPWRGTPDVFLVCPWRV